MRNTRVAQRYSKALMDMAVEGDSLETVRSEIAAIRKVTNEELREVMTSPIVRHEKKVEIFNSIFQNRISPLTNSFFSLVFSKGREWVLPEILEAFEAQYRKMKGIEIIELTTAVPVSEELKNEIKATFERLPRFQGKTFILKEKVDEKIIGGFVVQLGDQLFDASIRYNLKVIKQQFVENLYVQKIR